MDRNCQCSLSCRLFSLFFFEKCKNVISSSVFLLKWIFVFHFACCNSSSSFIRAFFLVSCVATLFFSFSNRMKVLLFFSCWAALVQWARAKKCSTIILWALLGGALGAIYLCVEYVYRSLEIALAPPTRFYAYTVMSWKIYVEYRLKRWMRIVSISHSFFPPGGWCWCWMEIKRKQSCIQCERAFYFVAQFTHNRGKRLCVWRVMIMIRARRNNK